jgi:hypothetical protein
MITPEPPEYLLRYVAGWPQLCGQISAAEAPVPDPRWLSSRRGKQNQASIRIYAFAMDPSSDCLRRPLIGMTGRLDGLPGHIPDPAMDSQRSAGAAVAGRLT